MLNNIVKLIYNKNNFIKFIILCILSYVIYFLYHKINNIKTHEGFVTLTSTSATFGPGESGTWTYPTGVTQATFTVIGGKGSIGSDNSGSIGGFGSNVTTTLSKPNTEVTYNIYVGNNGRTNPNTSPGTGGFSSDPNKLFSGGNGNSIGTGGGGSASLITDNNNTVIIVAGGGGGAGLTGASGGNGGINSNGAGGDGLTTIFCSDNTRYCAAGSGGSKFSTTYTSNIGSVGKGMNCGGGGGGYYGGNSIGISTGGGAGGSFVISNNSSNTTFATDKIGQPSILIEWTNPPTTTLPTTTLPTTTQYKPTTTQYQPTTTQYQPTTTQYQPTTTQYQPTTTQYQPTTTQYQPTTTQYKPTTTQYQPTTTQYQPTTTQYKPTTTQYQPTTTLPTTTTGARGVESLATTTTGAQGAESLATTTTGARGAESLATTTTGALGAESLTTTTTVARCDSRPTTSNNSLMDILSSDMNMLMRDIQSNIPRISSAHVIDLVNSGIDINTLTPSFIETSRDSNGNTNYKYQDPSIEINEVEFGGSSNVYSPYLYYDKNSLEKFDSVKNS